MATLSRLKGIETYVSYYQRGALIADKGKAHESFPDLEKAKQIAEWIGDENFVAQIKQKIHDVKQHVRQFHARATQNSENE